MQHANNVDLGEIAKFEALANRWWDPDSEFFDYFRSQSGRD